jgi:hypothetical protein
MSYFQFLSLADFSGLPDEAGVLDLVMASGLLGLLCLLAGLGSLAAGVAGLLRRPGVFLPLLLGALSAAFGVIDSYVGYSAASSRTGFPAELAAAAALSVVPLVMASLGLLAGMLGAVANGIAAALREKKGLDGGAEGPA